MPTIDINSDCGEGFGNWKMGRDHEIIPQVTTANLACGFHAGDPVTMLETIEIAKRHGVAVGAHPGLPDLLGFGRRAIEISAEDTYSYIVYQVGALKGLLEAHEMILHHVKPHGALYALRSSQELAEAAAQAIVDVTARPMLYWPVTEGNLLAEALQKRGGRVVPEFYPDLGYAPDGTPVLERKKRPVNPAEVTKRMTRFLEDGCVETIDGTLIPMDADSVCVHGDAPNALEVVRAIRQVLNERGWAVAAVSAVQQEE